MGEEKLVAALERIEKADFLNHTLAPERSAVAIARAALVEHRQAAGHVELLRRALAYLPSTLGVTRDIRAALSKEQDT